ncbi:MAG: hypothetical protein M3209_04850 [Acidobacteriota bacterium]|nr:hypothetical protein [Acidobacteriota bacterium]
MKFALIIAGLILVASAVFVSYLPNLRVQPSQQHFNQQPLPQQTPTQTEEKQLTVREGDIITKPDGWQLPDVTKLKKPERYKDKRFDYGVDVYRNVYETNRLELPLVGYDGKPDAVRKVAVTDLIVYDIKKRPFCYQVVLWNVPLEGEVGVGVVITQFYYDMDGDGRFESWDIASGLNKPLRIPQWAKQQL